MRITEDRVKKIVIVAVVAASFAAIFVRLMDTATPMAVAFYRLFFSVPFFAYVVLKGNRKALMEVKPKQLGICFLVGAMLALHFVAWFASLQYTSVASSIVLCCSHPIIVLILSYLFLKQKTNKQASIGVLLTIAGCIIISGGDYGFSAAALFGDALALFAAFCLALYFLIGSKMREKMDANVYVFLVFGSCLLTLFVGMIATSTPFFAYTPKEWLLFIALALICQIGSHAVVNWALGYIKPLFVSTAFTGEAISSTIWAMLIFAEIPTITQALGGMIVIGGIIVYTLGEQKTKLPFENQAQ